MVVSTLIAPATGSFLDRQQGRMLPPVSKKIIRVVQISEQRQVEYKLTVIFTIELGQRNDLKDDSMRCLFRCSPTSVR
eukprot:scaffold175132_cov65-Attheya_sp.AAC.1